MASEPRAHPRFAVEIDAEFRAADGPIPARTRDVSRGGMACYALKPAKVGIEYPVALSLVFGEGSLSEPLLLTARVVWCTPMKDGWQIGTSFIGIGREQRQYLDMFLRYLAEGLDQEESEATTDPGALPDEDDDSSFG